ncbi:DUF6372 family protein [Catenulispora yoronensis]
MRLLRLPQGRGPRGFCTRAAEPGLFAHVVSKDKIYPELPEHDHGTIVLCRDCYQALADRPEPQT